MPDFKHQWFGGHVYSQHGEDFAVLNIFKRLGIERPSYIDVGAHHPWELSNTALLYKSGSRGVCVEANPFGMHRFWEDRPEDRSICAAVVGAAEPGARIKLHRASHDSGINSTLIANLSAHGHMDSVEVDAVTLPQIVVQHAAGRWPDFLSIDAEGRDVEILQTVKAEAVKVICVEAVSQIGDISVEIRAWADRNGFWVHSWWGGNMLLVRDDLRRTVC